MPDRRKDVHGRDAERLCSCLRHRRRRDRIELTFEQEGRNAACHRLVLDRRLGLVPPGTPGELYHKPNSAFVADFIGQTNLLSGKIVERLISHAAEAVRAVPTTIREAGFGVGATRWEVIRSHVLPYAAPGILTGTILSLARAFGETAPLLLVGAVTGFLATGSGSLLETLRGPYTALPTIVFDWSRQFNFTDLTAAAIMVLLGTILVVNSVAIVLRNRYERKW